MLHLHVGGCGVHVGAALWEQLAMEHGVDFADGMASTNDAGRSVVFDEGAGGRWVPRSVFVDCDDTAIDHVRASRLGPLFRPDSFVLGEEHSAGVSVKCRYNMSAVEEEAMDAVRRRVELVDHFEGFHFTHAIGGGMGSGFVAALLDRFRSEYPDRTHTTTTVFPSVANPTLVTAPYNVCFAMHALIEHVDVTVCMSNDTLIDDARPTHAAANRVVAAVTSTILSGARSSAHQGVGRSGWRKLMVNSVPFPRMHFLIPSWTTEGCGDGTLEARLLRRLYDPTTALMPIAADERHLSVSAFLCGADVSHATAVSEFRALENKPSTVEWLPTSYVSVANRTPALHVQQGVALWNTSAVAAQFKIYSEQFTTMFMRRAHEWRYTQEGMDSMEFTEVESNMNDIISEFYWFEPYIGDEDEEEFGEDCQ